MSRDVYIQNYESGVLTNAVVTLSDEAGIYGIKDADDNVIVAAGAATVNESTGLYTYDISALDVEETYTATFKIVRLGGDTEYVDVAIGLGSALTAYATSDWANTYFGNKLVTDAWDATASNKNKALAQATSMIDRLNFRGVKTDLTQALQFPRDDDAVVPDDIKAACCEIAYSLLDDMDVELEFDNLSIISQSFSNVRSAYDRSTKPEHIAAGVPSATAWRYLKPYLLDVRVVGLNRIS